MTRAIIVFGENSGVWWLKFLKPGFRHCFILVPKGRHWILVDPTLRGIGLSLLPGMTESELMDWYSRKGLLPVRTPIQSGDPLVYPLAPLTCVEVAKRLIGIDRLFPMTPWQLYRFLMHKNKNKSCIRNYYIDTASYAGDKTPVNTPGTSTACRNFSGGLFAFQPIYSQSHQRRLSWVDFFQHLNPRRFRQNPLKPRIRQNKSVKTGLKT